MSQPAHNYSLPASSDDEATLAGLVVRARVGDHAAFAALFERYNAHICRYLARLVGDDDLGRDLAQDTFLAAWRGLPGIQDAARFVPWLYRIATNLARSHLRRARLIRWLSWGDASGHSGVGGPSVAGPEEQAAEAEYVALALAKMSPQCRACLLLQLEEGFSQREVAHLLGISEKSVSAYTSRGRQQFRQAYQRLERESEVYGEEELAYQRMDASIRALPVASPLPGLPPRLIAYWVKEEQRKESRGESSSSEFIEEAVRRQEGRFPSRPERPRERRQQRQVLVGLVAIAALALIALLVTTLFAVRPEPSPQTSPPAHATSVSATKTPVGKEGWAALPNLTNLAGLPALAPSNPHVIYTATLDGGGSILPTSVVLQRSDDDGASWQTLASPLGSTEVIWAGFFVSPFSAQNVFAEFNVDCASARVNPPGPVGALSSGSDVCTYDYYSADGGEHWSRIHWPVHGSASRQIRLGGFYPTSPFRTQGNRLYALLEVGLGNASSFVTSVDGGKTWQFADDALVQKGHCVYGYAPTPTGATVFAITVSPCNAAGALALNSLASPAAGGGGNELWRSNDAGAHWAELGSGFEGGNDLHAGLADTGRPTLYDDGFLPPTNTIPPTVTKASVDGGQTWQASPLGVYGQYATTGILGMLSDGSIVEGFFEGNSQLFQLFSWKAGDATWRLIAPDYYTTTQYLLVIPSAGGGPETLWLVSGDAGSYRVQYFTLQ